MEKQDCDEKTPFSLWNKNSINKETEEVKIPNGWAKVSFGQIVEPSKEKIEPENAGQFPYIGLESIERDTGRLIRLLPTNKIKSTKSVFKSGDLLYGKLRPYLNKVYVAQFDGICSTDILIFRKRDNLNTKFLFYRMLSRDFVAYATQNSSGVNHPRVNYKILSKFNMLLPPLNEQKRIVAKIEELFSRLDAGVESLKKAKTQLRRYRQSVLKAAFEGKLTEKWREKNEQKNFDSSADKSFSSFSKRDEVLNEFIEIPKCWRLDKLGNLVQDFRYGTSVKSKYEYKGLPVIRIPNIGNGILDLQDMKHLEKSNIPDNNRVKPGDLLIIRSNGSRELVGKCALVDKSADGWAFASYLIRIRPKNIVPKYLQYALSAEIIKKQFYSSAKSTAGINNINTKELSRTLVPAPSIPEQQKIVEEIERRFSIIDSLEKTINSLKEAERLRQAILKKAFEGRLVPQDPNDEPAWKLLERIKEEKKRLEAEKKNKKKRTKKGRC